MRPFKHRELVGRRCEESDEMRGKKGDARLLYACRQPTMWPVN